MDLPVTFDQDSAYHVGFPICAAARTLKMLGLILHWMKDDAFGTRFSKSNIRRMIFALTKKLNWQLSDMDGSITHWTSEFWMKNFPITLNISLTDYSSHNGMVVFG
jgi:hypothetical protein